MSPQFIVSHYLSLECIGNLLKHNVYAFQLALVAGLVTNLTLLNPVLKAGKE